MLSKSDIKLIKQFKEDNANLSQQLVDLKIIPKNLFNKLDEISKNLLEFSNKMINKKYTPEEIEKTLARTLSYKIYITSLNTDIEFMKVQVTNTRTNQKLKLLQEKYNPANGELDKSLLKEELDNDMLSLDSYIAFLKDLKTRMQNISNLLEKTFIVLTTQMKTDQSMFLNSDKISI